VGEVLLAWAPDDGAERTLRAPARATGHAVVEPGRPRRELAEVRRRGFARTAEEMSLGASSVAVPVTANRAGTPVVVGALGVVVPSHRRDSARLVPVLEVAARGTGREVGRTAARFQAVQPHAAIAVNWQALGAGQQQFGTAVGSINVSTPQGQQQLQAAEQQALTAAAPHQGNISVWVLSNCGGGASGSATSSSAAATSSPEPPPERFHEGRLGGGHGAPRGASLRGHDAHPDAVPPRPGRGRDGRRPHRLYHLG
jgi:hypothetical protein